MSLTKEKKFGVAGFQVAIPTQPERAEKNRRSPLYKYLVKPGLSLVNGRDDRTGTNGHNSRPAAVAATAGPDVTRLTGKAAEIWEKVSRIGWYHTIDLPERLVTPGFIDNRDTV